MTTKDTFNKSTFPPLLHLSFVLQQVADETLDRGAGIGISQARIMSVLHSSVPRSQRVTASRLGQTESNVSRQLQQMKRHGLVSVTKSKKDGRQRDVTLTAKGAKKYAQAEKILKKQQASLLRLLSGSEVKAFERAARNLSAQHNLDH
jgi:DNA-binding MarR family transcriptional regulator